MRIMVFDTETISIDKPFCYNVGYCIYDTESAETLCHKDRVVEQVWHNTALFASAYYAEKRPLYVERMRAKRTVMDKWGYICSEMRRDIKSLGVEIAYAFNSSFDERVFSFNCDWFKTLNPFDEIPVLDIRAFAIQYLANNDYKKWCEESGNLTENGNYSTTAEAFERYLTKNDGFIEEHTALADSFIELDVLLSAKECGDITKSIPCPKYLERKKSEHWKVKVNRGVRLEVDCTKMIVSKSAKEIRFTE